MSYDPYGWYDNDKFDKPWPDDFDQEIELKPKKSKLENELDKYIEELEKEKETEIDDNCPIDIQWDPENQVFIIDGVTITPDKLKTLLHKEDEEEVELEETEAKDDFDEDLPF